MSRYIVSVRREKKRSGLSTEEIQKTSGVHVVYESARGGLVIEADKRTVDGLQKNHGGDFIIEPEILHVSL